MDIKSLQTKIRKLTGKYRYVLIILAIGLVLMMLPDIRTVSQKNNVKTPEPEVTSESIEEKLCSILREIDGVGEVSVLLTVATEGTTHYQADSDITVTDQTDDQRHQTVIVTDADRNQSGLISKQDAPVYRGAVIVCQGGDNPTVRLSVTQAVARATGLHSDQICILKMK